MLDISVCPRIAYWRSLPCFSIRSRLQRPLRIVAALACFEVDKSHHPLRNEAFLGFFSFRLVPKGVHFTYQIHPPCVTIAVNDNLSLNRDDVVFLAPSVKRGHKFLRLFVFGDYLCAIEVILTQRMDVSAVISSFDRCLAVGGAGCRKVFCAPNRPLVLYRLTISIVVLTGF